MSLSERQMHDLAGRLTRLRAIASDGADASRDEREACERRNKADALYATVWVETARQFGEANAPPWMAFRGPKPSVEVTG